jgi:uncharacterized lipoprotein
LKQFLQEDNGRYSSARLLALLSVLSFITDWVKHIVVGVDFNPSWTIVGFVLGVVGIKVVQKFAELKNGENKTTDIQT